MDSARKLRHVIVVFVCLLLSERIYAESTLLSVDHSYPMYKLNAFASYYLDKESVENVTSVQNVNDWRKNIDANVLSFGFVDYPVWIKMPIIIDASGDQGWYVVIPYPLLQKADLYVVSKKDQSILWSNEYGNPITQSHLWRSNYIVFKLPASIVGEVDLILRAQSATSLQIPLELWSQNYLVDQQNLEMIFWGLYFGAMLALVFYNGFLFVSTLDSTYSYYVMTLLSVSVLMLCISGMGEMLLWENRKLTPIFLSLASCATSFWLLCFTNSFLKSEVMSSVISVLIRVLAVLSLAQIVYVIATEKESVYLSGCLGAVVIAVVMSAGILAWKSGEVIARYFILASASFALGASLYIANVFSWIPSTEVTNNAFQVGSVFEALLFSFALAHKIKEERRQKIEAYSRMDQTHKTMVKIQTRALDQALHDPLTSMPNDSCLNKRIDELISSKSSIDAFAVVLLYFPELKEISSSMGRRLAEDFFSSIVKKLNGDLECDAQSICIEEKISGYISVVEFGSLVFLCKIGVEFRSIHSLVGDVLDQYESTLEVNGSSFRLNTYAGISMYPKHGDRADLLIQHVSAARDYGLRSSEHLSVYSSEIDAFGRRRLAMLGALSDAIKDGGLELYLQPQFECRTKKMIGAEALLRWNSDVFGVVSPVEFIEVAEEAGLMPKLTRYVVDEAFRLLHQIQKSGLMISLSINLSIKNLIEKNIVSYIVDSSEMHFINLSDIVFEVTESCMSEDMDQVADTLNQLASAGCCIALDDYGTGYSSLAYLSRLPIHELKIDRSFINQMKQSDSDFRIVENTVKLAAALQIHTVAEGVEDAETMATVTQMGCDRVQGYFLAKPMSFAHFQEWVFRDAG